MIAIASIGAAVTNIVLNYLFIPRFGFYAAGYTTLVSYTLFAACHYMFMKIVCSRNQYTKALFDLKGMLITMILFFAGSTFFLMLYERVIVRLTISLLIIITMIWKRSAIMAVLKPPRR